MADRIKEGDYVLVNFNHCAMTLSHCARVEHVPVATGDSWIFKDVSTNKLHYVSEGCSITKLNAEEVAIYVSN